MKNNQDQVKFSAGTLTAGNVVSLRAKKKKNEKVSLGVYRFFVYFVMIILTIICLFPFYVLLVNSSYSSADIMKGFHWWFGGSFAANWNTLFNDSNIPLLSAFGNSLIISLSASVLTVYFSALTAYATHIYSFKGKKIITTFILAIMMIPTQVSAMGLVMACIDLGLTNQIWVLIVPAVASPVTYFYMKQYLESVLPFEVIEASRVDGASEIRIFHQIVLPILKPAMSVQFIFAYVSNWNNFFLPSMLLENRDVKTIPIVLTLLTGSSPATFDKGEIYMLLTVAVLPLLIVYLIFSKGLIKNLTSGSVKG